MTKEKGKLKKNNFIKCVKILWVNLSTGKNIMPGEKLNKLCQKIKVIKL